MPQSSMLSIELDVHQETIAVASLAKGHDAEVIDLGTIGTRHCDIDKLLRNRQSKATLLVFVYEVGPGGSWLYRSLRNKAHDCWVVAPSLTPQKAGAHVKTARRDAVPLARLRCSGALTPVDVPTVADEATRGLSRAREDAMRDLTAAKFRLNAFWLRQAIRSTARATGSPAPLRWLSEVVCPTPAQHSVLHDYGRAVAEHTARLWRLEPALQDQATAWR